MSGPNNLGRHTGRIVNWDGVKGYGFVDDGNRRIFVHIRDFAEHHKIQEAGDLIVYAIGTDIYGRTCAKHAIHLNDVGRIRGSDVILLALLLIAPGLALYRLVENSGSRLLWAWTAGLSLYTYFTYSADKKRARAGNQRFTENKLHILGLLGGWPGAFLAQRRLRHKIRKANFQLMFWLTVAAYQFVAIDWHLNWRITHQAVKLYDRINEQQK